MRNILLTSSLALSLGAVSLNAEAQIVKQSELKKTTVYLNGAVLEHQAQINLPAGQSEVIIRNVANQIVNESLQVGISEGVTILNVNHRRWQATESEMANNQLKSKEWLEAQNTLKNIQQEKKAIEATLKMISNPASMPNTNQLTAAQWEALTNSYLNKQKALMKELEEWTEKEKDQQVLIKRLQDQGEGNNNYQFGEVVLQVQSPQSRNAKIEFQYITNAASWQPEYELSTKDGQSNMQIQFKASVRQNTGINWKDVSMVLATSNPMSYSALPTLNPWFLGFMPSFTQEAYASPAPTMMKSRAASTDAMMEEMDYGGMQGNVVVEEGAMYDEYVIGIPTSVTSNNQPQTLTIQQSLLPIKKEYLVIPKQSSAVHMVAKLSSKDQKNTMPGSATILNNNKYVGKTYFNPKQLKDTLSISLGTDQRIQVSRQKVNDFTAKKTFGSKRVDEYGFKITLQNTKSETITVKVQEQVPISRDKDLEISLTELNGGVFDAKKGIITWEIELAPKQVKHIEYALEMKYPKDKEVQDLY